MCSRPPFVSMWTAYLCVTLPSNPHSPHPPLGKSFSITFDRDNCAAPARGRHCEPPRWHYSAAVLFKTDGDNVKKYWMPNG